MVSLVKKRIRGRPYYYARQSQRVDGKPTIVWQKYLGPPDQIVAVMTGNPVEALVRDFGAVAALYDLAQRLRLADCIDRHVPKQRNGPSVGTYLLVAVLNRCVAPCSKASTAKWFENTILDRLIDIEPRQLTSQRFWDNMNRIPLDAIPRIERDIMTGLARDFDVDLERVLATNSFTFIDAFNERCALARRDHDKEGREAPRIVGLALLVTADFHLPLLHRTYAGSQPDTPAFASLTDGLVARYSEINRGAERITLIFDKGDNLEDNLEAAADSPHRVIGSLVPTQHPELLETPADRLRPLDSLDGVSAWRTTRTLFGAERTVLVTYDEKLFAAQSRTLLRKIAKRRQRLRELQNRLRRWRAGRVRSGKPPTAEGTSEKVAGWLRARHMKELFKVTVEVKDGLPTLRYRFDRRAWQRLQRTLLGKTLIFTDNADWTDDEIVRGYQAQHRVENAFRYMKNTHRIAPRPQHHGTEIAVHVFCSVLALLLRSLLQREMHRRGLPKPAFELVDQLGRIREIGVVYPGKNPTVRMTLSQMTGDQRTLYEALDLKRYQTE